MASGSFTISSSGPPCDSSPGEELLCPPLPDAAETSRQVMGWLRCLFGWHWVRDNTGCRHTPEQATPM